MIFVQTTTDKAGTCKIVHHLTHVRLKEKVVRIKIQMVSQFLMIVE